MTKVKFEDIKISILNKGANERELCHANMVVNNKQIPVQLQKSNTGEWAAISLESKIVHPLSTNNKESFEDWFNDSEAEVCGAILQPK